jgi:hypothetical protein
MFDYVRRLELRTSMKHYSITSKFILSIIATASIGASAFAQSSVDKVDLSLLGNLVRNNAKGDYKYPGVYKFTRSGSRAYINHFARKLAKNDSEIPQYEDVLKQGVRVWEEEQGPLGYTNDLSGGLAFYTMVNSALGSNQPYQENYLGNMVAQFRKAFSSKSIAVLSSAKKQDMYDYMITESVYMQALASAGQERNLSDTADLLMKMGSMQIRTTYKCDASKIEITESGVTFK